MLKEHEKQIEALIEAGKFLELRTLDDCRNNEISPSELPYMISGGKKIPLDPRAKDFYERTFNARPAIKAMYAENKRLRVALKEASKGCGAIDEMDDGVLDRMRENTRAQNPVKPTAALDPDMPADELRLHMGELTPDEVLVARAAIRWANIQNPMKAVVVPLVWKKISDTFYEAETPFGSYYVTFDSMYGWGWHYEETYEADVSPCTSLEDGKAQAQKHWEERLAGCVEVVPTIEVGAIVAIVEEALQDQWNDWCADTGCFPDDFQKKGRFLYFEAGKWAGHVGDQVENTLRRRYLELTEGKP